MPDLCDIMVQIYLKKMVAAKGCFLKYLKAAGQA
jgi:hypothetical protein